MLTIFHGFAMGVANSVPGVSGGTIAFILGFYDKFINSFHNIFSKDKKTRKDAIIYLVKILAGLAVGLLLCVVLLTTLFEKYVYELCSAFIGLTVAAIPFVVIQEKDTLRGKYLSSLWALAGVAVVAGISLMRTLGITAGNVSFVNGLTAVQYLYVFVAGLLAISAMILPGISGSTILLIFGVYMPVLEGVKEFIKFNWSFGLIAGLCVFGIGVLSGVVISIKCIKVALEKYRSGMVWLVLGMMAGSVYAIMMGPTTLDTAQPAMKLTLMQPDGIRIIALAVGAAILVGLEFLKKYTEKKANG